MSHYVVLRVVLSDSTTRWYEDLAELLNSLHMHDADATSIRQWYDTGAPIYNGGAPIGIERITMRRAIGILRAYSAAQRQAIKRLPSDPLAAKAVLMDAALVIEEPTP